MQLELHNKPTVYTCSYFRFRFDAVLQWINTLQYNPAQYSSECSTRHQNFMTTSTTGQNTIQGTNTKEQFAIPHQIIYIFYFFFTQYTIFLGAYICPLDYCCFSRKVQTRRVVVEKYSEEMAIFHMKGPVGFTLRSFMMVREINQ